MSEVDVVPGLLQAPIPNRAPGTIWSLRDDYRDVVRTTVNEMVHIRYDGRELVVDRKDARLLAKRINECLDATAKKRGAKK